METDARGLINFVAVSVLNRDASRMPDSTSFLEHRGFFCVYYRRACTKGSGARNYASYCDVNLFRGGDFYLLQMHFVA